MTAPPSARLRIAGVDYGARRVGIALTDPLRMFARPVGTFGPGEALDVLARLHAEEGLAVVVVGWPVLHDGAEGAAVDRVRPFVGRVRKQLPDVRVEVQDEYGSSRRAMAGLVEAGARRGRRRQRGVLDAAAACVILQDWLDEHGVDG